MTAFEPRKPEWATASFLGDTGVSHYVHEPRRNLDFVPIMNDLLMLWDFVAVLVAASLAAMAYSWLFVEDVPLWQFWHPFYGQVIMAAVVSPLLLRDHSMTCLARFRHREAFLGRLLRSGAFLLLIMVALGFATHSLDRVARLWVAGWIALTLIFSALGRLLLASYLHRLAESGELGDRVAIVGAGRAADQLLSHFRNYGHSIHVVGVFDDSDDIPSGCTPPRGKIADIVKLAARRPLDWVVLTLPPTAEDRIAEILRKLKTVAAQIALCPEPVKLSLPCRQVDDLGEMPMLLLAERPLRRWDLIAKEVEDKVIASLLLLLALPVFLLIMVAIRLDSPGPIIFRQKRHGWNNSEFTIFKFRTMRVEPETGVLQQTRRDDARLTRVGAFLRRFSLDELPQLLNVLRGDMSIVGPRPHAIYMRTEDRLGDEIIADYAHRHRVKPGITGWAQVNGYRGATERVEQLRKRVEYDLFYIENWSLLFDLKIIALTCLRLFTDENAF
jgi:Undecaprenyl-phosphate glucose phosphotransferase